MQKKISDMKRMVIILLVVEAALLFLFRVGLDKGIFSATITRPKTKSRTCAPARKP